MLELEGKHWYLGYQQVAGPGAGLNRSARVCVRFSMRYREKDLIKQENKSPYTQNIRFKKSRPWFFPELGFFRSRRLGNVCPSARDCNWLSHSFIRICR